MAKVAIISAGAWGTALGSSLGRNGHEVQLWAREEQVCSGINNLHENTRYLPGIKLAPTVSASTDMSKVCEGSELIILASPSIYLVQTVQSMLQTETFTKKGLLPQNVEIGIITKGFIADETGYPQLITEALEKILPEEYRSHLVYIAGPSHAEEVGVGKLTGLVAASQNAMASIRTREILKSNELLVYASLDIIGVQTCAAVKNVIAIAFGILDALTESTEVFGDNTESLLLAAGLNEIQTIGRALGATHSETFTSISGVGDLDVTCRSKFGRNRRFGLEIVNSGLLDDFKNIDDIIANVSKIPYLPEGVFACKYVNLLAESLKIKLPIASGLYKILNKEVKPKEFIERILRGEVN